MLSYLLWLPKHLFLAHYVLAVNLLTPSSRAAETDARCERMYQRLFREKL